MNSFFRFMVSPVGGILRVVVGLALVVIGICWVQGPAGWTLVITGLLPLVASVFDKCVFAALFKLPADGTALRQKIE